MAERASGPEPRSSPLGQQPRPAAYSSGRSHKGGVRLYPVVRAWNRDSVSGTVIASSATLQSVALRAGCCSGQDGLAGVAVGLPKSVRPARNQESALIWARPEPGSRRPRYTRDQIAAKALQIADADGIDAVSMRRVAAELDAGTMTLYHYVRTKNELITLMDDAIMGEVLVPDDELSADWREALTQIAHRVRAAFARHPWALSTLSGAHIGPNALRHFEQSLAAVADLNITTDRQLELISLVDDYTFGYLSRAANPERAADNDQMTAAINYIDQQIQTGCYPHINRLIGDGTASSGWEQITAIIGDDQRYDRGLQRLLDGFEQDLSSGAERRESREA